MDNLTVSVVGNVLVAEDGAEMRTVAIGRDVTPFELVNVLGPRGSEICESVASLDFSRGEFQLAER